MLQQAHACTVWFADGEGRITTEVVCNQLSQPANFVVVVKVGAQHVPVAVDLIAQQLSALSAVNCMEGGTARWSGVLCCIPRLCVHWQSPLLECCKIVLTVGHVQPRRHTHASASFVRCGRHGCQWTEVDIAASIWKGSVGVCTCRHWHLQCVQWDCCV